MQLRYLALTVFWVPFGWSADSTAPQAQEIVERSVANTNADWAVAPQYNYTERDVVTKGGQRTERTYQVMMIEGSPYNKLIAINNEPVSPTRAAIEERKLKHEIARRRRESPAARQKRVAEYQKERRQDHSLMSQMVKGFDFSLTGEETINGRRCFVLNATPKPGYRPPTRDSEVLQGMRGKMWVDTQQYQWVKVQAEVFRPVTFGLFFACVKPGTEFIVEEAPVRGNLWLPSHFYMNVNARVLVWSRRCTEDERYSNYHPATVEQAMNH